MLDQVVHKWLGHRRVIAFVVSAATVANDVDYYVLFEFLSVIESKLRYSNYCLRVIAIDVEDWSLNRLCNIGCVNRGSGILGQGGKSNLVVHHDVDGATNLVTLKLAHLHGFRDNALTNECCITVD